jgi:proline iminopeptidase
VGERFVTTADGVRLWTIDEGIGIPLVLCHGGAGLWDYLGPVSSMVNDQVRVVRWDQRGCGRSGPSVRHTVGGYVEDLEAIRLDYGIEAWIVGGHSWGASLALAYALQHPDRTQAVVYISGTGIGRAWNRAYHDETDRRRTRAQRERLARLEDRTRNDAEEHEYRVLAWSPDIADQARAKELVAHLDAPYDINTDANRQLSAETKTWDEGTLAGQCRTMTAPVLVLHGESDPRPPWAIDSLAAALPSASVVVLPDVGHLPWLEAPEATRERLRHFLSTEVGADP